MKIMTDSGDKVYLEYIHALVLQGLLVFLKFCCGKDIMYVC